jgi:DNA adenine methylase
MVGAGALYFAIRPRQALLADINQELIGFYRILRDRPSALIRALMAMRASEDTYLELRASSPVADLDRAVRFAYLNRLCWNGIYRVNKKGQFNVPMGDRLPSVMWRPERLEAAARALAGATLRVADFQLTLAGARHGDFVYIDPPYPRGSVSGFGFARYSVDGFGEVHHRALAEEVLELDRRGVNVMLTLADAPFVESVYPQSFRRISRGPSYDVEGVEPCERVRHSRSSAGAWGRRKCDQRQQRQVCEARSRQDPWILQGHWVPGEVPSWIRTVRPLGRV